MGSDPGGRPDHEHPPLPVRVVAGPGAAVIWSPALVVLALLGVTVFVLAVTLPDRRD